MTAGIQPTIESVNQQAGQMAVNLRDDFSRVVNFNAWITAVGGVNGLVSIGFPESDAQVIVSTYGNLAALAAIYQGQSALAQAFNYEINSNVLWGGQ